MFSMVLLRNRLAAGPSPSSPGRSRDSQAIWKDSSSSWESELVMVGKRTRTARVPCHRRTFAPFDCHRFQPEIHSSRRSHVGFPFMIDQAPGAGPCSSRRLATQRRQRSNHCRLHIGYMITHQHFSAPGLAADNGFEYPLVVVMASSHIAVFKLHN